MKTLEWDQYYTCTNTCMSVVILCKYTSSHSVSSKWECVVYFICESELVLTLLIEVVCKNETIQVSCK